MSDTPEELLETFPNPNPGRDFTIDIEPYMEIGFTMKWITLIRYTDRTPKTKRHKVSFLPYRKRPGIFYSVIKKNLFGNVTSSDPLTGEPYVWAALKGNKLTMNALYITDNGGPGVPRRIHV